MSHLLSRHEFVLIYDVTNGNPNGDPDSGNMPRTDIDTGRGLVTDVAIKRKVRDFIELFGSSSRKSNDIFVKSRRPLNPLIAEAAAGSGLPTHQKPNGGWDGEQAKKRSSKDVGAMQAWLCEKYFDIRAFGGVLSTGPNAGQIRGPVQLTFSMSAEPISAQEHTITRVADVDKEEGEMGRKHIVPYGLYRAHGFVSAKLAERTGFDDADLELLFQALEQMFDHDRSAARGEMATRKLVVFRHSSALGNAPAHKLFDLVKVGRNVDGALRTIGDAGLDNLPPARSFNDYRVEIDHTGLPDGVEIIERI
jgi:CRISPR-associated protein Csd2